MDKAITPFTLQDFDNLYNFMLPIWKKTYKGIISDKQIDFLVNKYFKKENVDKFLQQGYEYYKIFDKGVLIFLEREKDIFLDKLYLDESLRGKNIPSLAFEFLLKRKKDITLNVNQGNERAVKCYLKNGFTIEVSHDVVLENGMINKDYIMRKKYKNEWNFSLVFWFYKL